MAAAAARRAPRPLASGLAVGTHCPVTLPAPLTWLPSSHPVPDTRSQSAGAQALALAAAVASDELLLVLISGGASALLAHPRSGITLEDKQATTTLLLRGGADIAALNTVRKHLSSVKGGQLAAACRGRTLALAVSDVVGDDLSVIGSGPTVPDPSTFADALRVLAHHGGLPAFPAAVVGLLEAGAQGQAAETPKPGDAWEHRTATRLIGSRRDAIDGAAAAAAAAGYDVSVVPEPIVGEAREAGPRLVRLLDARWPAGAGVSGERPRCLIAAGETTVTVRGKGRGGRNQELVLAAARELERRGRACALLSGGTDGIDGPTNAAGAMADHTTLARAAARGLPGPARFLDDNDAYAFFEALSDLVITGPTDTNVGDVQLLLTV